jgi:hypothetical protein
LNKIEDKSQISDGYHTFAELYEHRDELFIALCRYIIDAIGINAAKVPYVWKSRVHSDGTFYDGYFIAGIRTEKGYQISYHLQDHKWDRLPAFILERAPEYDGHTSQDVIQRLKRI